MAMIVCTECGKKFSDKAVSCPNCGIPIEDVLIEIEKRKQEEAAKPKTEVEPEKQFPQNAQPTKAQKKAKAGGFIPLLLAGILTVLYLGFAIPDYFGGAKAVEHLASGIFSLAGLTIPDILGSCGIQLSELAESIGMDPENFAAVLHLGITGGAFLFHFLGMMGKFPFLLFLSVLCYLAAMAVAPGCVCFLLLETLLVLIGLIRMKKSLR